MRQDHPVFAKTPAQSEVIWRYFDLPKFVSMIERRGLYFARADQLGDRLEGSFSQANEIERKHLLEDPPDGMTQAQVWANLDRHAEMRRQFSRAIYVNSWHIGSHESMAMWQGYGNGAYGIAIRSTFGALDSVLPQTVGGDRYKHIYLGTVNYIDHTSDTDIIPNGMNMLGPFVCKSVVFQHECEVRAVFVDNGNMSTLSNREYPLGHFVPVDLTALIQSVTVSPLAPSWFEEVTRTLCKQFGFDFSFVPSVATAKPIYG